MTQTQTGAVAPKNRSRKFHTLMVDIVILAISAYFISCAKTTTEEVVDTLPPCAITAPFDSVFSNIFPENEPGAIVAVMRGDSIVYRRGFGLARLDKPTQITDSTLFNLSSASKIFTAAALLKLSEQGLLNLDDSIAKFFPEFNSELFDKITVREILTHSSGLPDIRPKNENEWEKYVASHNSIFTSIPDYRLYGKETEHMQVFQNLKALEFEPGTHYQRHDPAFILVAPLIERVTGENFNDWMQANIFAPAGMKETFYYTPGSDSPNMAHGYRKASGDKRPLVFRSEDGKWDEYDYGEADFFLTRADRGVYSSARDFMQWNRALYAGKIISQESLKDMRREYIPTDIDMVSFGLGTAIRNELGFPIKVYHLNSNGGFSIVEGAWPDSNLYYIVFSCRPDWDLRAVTSSIDSIVKAKEWI